MVEHLNCNLFYHFTIFILLLSFAKVSLWGKKVVFYVILLKIITTIISKNTTYAKEMIMYNIAITHNLRLTEKDMFAFTRKIM